MNLEPAGSLGLVALIDFRLISGIRWSGSGVLSGKVRPGNPGISVITPLRKDPIGATPYGSGVAVDQLNPLNPLRTHSIIREGESVLYSTEMKSTCRSGTHISVLMGDTGILTSFRLGTHHVRAQSNYINTIYFYGFNLCDWRINTLSTGGGVPCQFSYCK